MAKMVFSKTKRFVGVYDKGMVIIEHADTKELIAKFTEKENDADKTMEKYLIALENAYQINNPYENMNDIEKMINSYESCQTPEIKLNLKIILFFMKKMEYMNKKVYKVAIYIKLIENMDIKLEKDWNPFEKQISEVVL